MTAVLPAGRVCPSTPGVRVQIDLDLASWLRLNVFRAGQVSVELSLEAAKALSERDLRPGGGRTAAYFSALATAGLVDATLARVVEPHLDARAILGQAAIPFVIREIGTDATSTWGVYAANAAGHHLSAHRDADGWSLSGTKPWCSLATKVSHAVITAETAHGGSCAFAVRLDPQNVAPLPAQWISRGLAAVVSTGIRVDRLPAVPVGEVGWYTNRPGFNWGAVGVAAVWFGIAMGLYDRMLEEFERRPPDQIALAHLGTVDRDLSSAQMSLQHAANEIDAGRATGEAGDLLSLRVRAIVAAAVENTLAVAAKALGPAPLTSDECFARRVADLSVYIRQHHAERDLVRLAEISRAGAVR